MSLTHALLGLLAVAPASGYELSREFEGDLGRYAWQAGHTSIYPELNRMAARGLVEVMAEGPRGAKTYDVTGEGRAELRRWLLDGPDRGSTVRNEQVLRMFLLTALEPADQERMLDGIAEHTAAAAARLRSVVEQPVADPGPRAGFGLLAAHFGIYQYEAVHDWAVWARQQLIVSTTPDALPRKG